MSCLKTTKTCTDDYNIEYVLYCHFGWIKNFSRIYVDGEREKTRSELSCIRQPRRFPLGLRLPLG